MLYMHAVYCCMSSCTLYTVVCCHVCCNLCILSLTLYIVDVAKYVEYRCMLPYMFYTVVWCPVCCIVLYACCCLTCMLYTVVCCCLNLGVYLLPCAAFCFFYLTCSCRSRLWNLFPRSTEARPFPWVLSYLPVTISQWTPALFCFTVL